MSFKFDWARKRKSGSTNSDATSTTNDGVAVASEPPPLLSPHRRSSLTYAAASGRGAEEKRRFSKAGGSGSGSGGSFSFLSKSFWRPSKKSRGSDDKRGVPHVDGHGHYDESYGYGGYSYSSSYGLGNYGLGHAAPASEPCAATAGQPSSQLLSPPQPGGGVYSMPEPATAEAFCYDFASEEEMRRHHDKLNAFTFKFGRTRPRRASDLYSISPNNSYRAIYDDD